MNEARSTVNRDAVARDLRRLKRAGVEPTVEEIDAEVARRHDLEIEERRQTNRARVQGLAVKAHDALEEIFGSEPIARREELTVEEQHDLEQALWKISRAMRSIEARRANETRSS